MANVLKNQAGALISVIVCTYGRASALKSLLRCLEAQDYGNVEVLIVDGNGEVSPARDTLEEFLGSGSALRVDLVKSEKGLTRQRNLGLKIAKGSVICFVDDDVTFERDFLGNVATLFGQPHMRAVGGITPYDTINYPAQITWRWRLRNLLGAVPSLEPGQVDHLGRAVPLSFLKPWNGRKEVGWLGGFCMIYRRAAIEGLRFDEVLPTYAGEDRDFSMRVGAKWRLLICGDLSIQHHYSLQGRDQTLERLRQSSFGVGRRFAQNAKSAGDYLTVAQTFLGDFVVDFIALLRRPSRENWMTLSVRLRASFSGLRSIREERPRGATPILGAESLEHSDSISRTP